MRTGNTERWQGSGSWEHRCCCKTPAQIRPGQLLTACLSLNGTVLAAEVAGASKALASTCGRAVFISSPSLAYADGIHQPSTIIDGASSRERATKLALYQRKGFLGQLTCTASMAVPKNGIAFDPGSQGLSPHRPARGRCRSSCRPSQRQLD